MKQTAPLFFRWVEDRQVAERLLEIWRNILNINSFWQKLPKSKRPNSKSFLNLQSAINDLITPTKLSFFSFIAGILQLFLVKYQTDDPVVPYLYNDLFNIIKKIMSFIVKPDIMIKRINGADVKITYLSNKDNFVEPKDKNVGFSTTAVIADLRKKDLVTKKQIADFFSDVITFLVSLIEKMFDRCPISYSVVRYASIFDPKEMISVDAELLQSKLKKVYSILSNWVS